MLARAHAYEVGFIALNIGAHFNGAAILQVARRQGASAPLVARIDHVLGGWPARGPNVVAGVRHVEQLMRDAGIAPPAQPPRDLDEYLAWASAIGELVGKSLVDPAAPPGADAIEGWKRKWTHLLGTTVGDALQVVELRAMIQWLLEAEPAHAWLRTQADALASNQRALAGKLRKLLDDNRLMRNFGDATVAAAERIHAMIAATDAGALVAARDAIAHIDLRPTFA